jgi:hypothetical protein
VRRGCNGPSLFGTSRPNCGPPATSGVDGRIENRTRNRRRTRDRLLCDSYNRVSIYLSRSRTALRLLRGRRGADVRPDFNWGKPVIPARGTDETHRRPARAGTSATGGDCALEKRSAAPCTGSRSS